MIKTALMSLTAFLLLAAVPAMAAVEVGKPAPDFTGTDTHGTEHTLSDFKGKTVVLEWSNHGCPYVQKHYGTGNMQALQKEATDDGVVWLTIVSSAPGKQGYTTPEEANALMEEQNSHPTARILDPEGTIGKLYDAKTTPHMFVIDKDGTLVYDGAIDDQNAYQPETIEGATNYVREALHALKTGTEIEVTSTTPYGCSVKY